MRKVITLIILMLSGLVIDVSPALAIHTAPPGCEQWLIFSPAQGAKIGNCTGNLAPNEKVRVKITCAAMPAAGFPTPVTINGPWVSGTATDGTVYWSQANCPNGRPLRTPYSTYVKWQAEYF